MPASSNSSTVSGNKYCIPPPGSSNHGATALISYGIPSGEVNEPKSLPYLSILVPGCKTSSIGVLAKPSFWGQFIAPVESDFSFLQSLIWGCKLLLFCLP